ncbi:MAG: SEL1-like repeat protein [Hyphomicrobiales bacterium]|nr:SEL1-like repeat protein [Hyphomicrobiales bacterium]
MNKAAPWNIKGVDSETRDAAREAAEREGLTVGEWLNDVISERAAGAEAEDDAFDEEDDDRLNAVSSRIARIRDTGLRPKRRADARAPRAREFEEEEIAPRRARETDDFTPRRSRDMSRRAREREVSWRESADAEALLEDAIDAFEARVSRSQAKTARTLAEVAELVQNSNARGARETHLLKSIARRLADIENRVAVADDVSDRPVRNAISRIEGRVEDIKRRGDGGQSRLGDIDAKLSEIAAQLDRTPADRSPENARLARIETQIAALATQLEKNATQAAAPAPAMSAAAPGQRRPLLDAVSQIALRQRELDGEGWTPPRRIDQRQTADARRAQGELDTRLSGLQGDIARMSAHLEKMREDAAVRAAAPADGSLDKLRAEIAAVSRGLNDLAPRASVAAIERNLRQMADRLEAMRQEAGRVQAATPVDQIADELRAGMRELDARPAIGALERGMRAISDKLENLEARGGVDPQTVRAIYDQTREVRDLLSRAATVPGEKAQRELADLAQKIQQTGGGIAPGEVARIIADIRAVVAEGVGGDNLRALEKRIDQLSHRIDAALSADTGGAHIAAFSERLDKLHRAVAQSLATPRQQPAADTHHLEELVRDLATKVDRAADPNAGRDELLALQHQIESLSTKIERSSGADETVVSLERMINELFDQLNDSRLAAVEAAEGAARSAVREAMATAPAAVAPDTSGLVREIADLRQIQDVADQRTHATLKAVHETLERVVDRLSTLEDDIVESRTQDRRAAPAARIEERPLPPPAPVAPPSPPAGVSMSAAAALARKKGPPPVEQPRGADRAESSAAPAHDILIEPGAGPRVRPLAGSGDQDQAGRSAQASLIEAARRAQRAVKAASASLDAPEKAPAMASEGPAKVSALAQARLAYERRRKPILLGLAALVILLGGAQVAKLALGGGAEPASVAHPATPAKPDTKNVSQAPDATAKPPVADAETKPAAPAADDKSAAPGAPAPQSKSPSASIDAAPPPDKRSEAATPAAPVVANAAPSEPAKVDPTPVGAINTKAPDPAVEMAAIETLAARGDAAAQYELGARRADGVRTARNPKGAAEMFEKSATKGFAPAQYRLGVVYERGLGLARDSMLAKLWYQRAADRGNVRAMHNLAVLLADNDGKPDYAGAAKWFRKAAEYGVRDSQYNLAILYARGMGGPQDLVQSYAWFAAAAAQGDEDAGKKRDDIASRLDPASLARAKNAVAAFRPRPIDPAVNEVAPPPGGWQALLPPKDDKARKPTMSRL